MAFKFIEDPRWNSLDEETKKKVLDLSFYDDVASDKRWAGLPSDNQSTIKGLYLQDARNYEKSLLPETPGLLGGLKHFVRRAGSVLTDVVPETIGRTIRGGDTSLKKSFLDEWIETNEREKEESKELSPDVRKQTWVNTPFGPITYAHLEDAPDSLGYSIANAFAAGGGAKAGGVAGLAVSGGNPIIGAAGTLIGAFLGGTAVSSRATKDQFIDDMQKKYLKSVGGKITPETEQRWGEIRKELNSDANWYGFWEAAPETVGNMLTFGIFKYGGKLTKPLFSKIKNNIAAKVGTNAAKMAEVLSEEELTEALTTMEQSEIEAKRGLRKQLLSYTESAKEVWPTVALTTPLLGGGGAVAAKLTQGQQQQIPEKTPSQKISDVINDGMTTGKVNGQPFTQDHVINLIKKGYLKGIFNDADIGQFKERYPELIEGLGEDVSPVADIGKATSVDEAVTSFEKATSGDEELNRVYGAARKRVGLLTPQAIAEKEYEAYAGPELPWQTMKEGEGVEVMARPQGLLQPQPQAGPTNIYELQKRVRQHQGKIAEEEKRVKDYQPELPPVKPEIRLRKAPPTYPEGAKYVAGKKAPENLRIEHKPILRPNGVPWKTMASTERALKKSARLKDLGISVRTHKIIEAPGGGYQIVRLSDKGVAQKKEVKEKVKGKTLLSWVRAMGGIKDASLPGEVRALSGKETGVIGLTTKRTDKGLGFDEMASAAVEHGWLSKNLDNPSGAFSELLRNDIFAQKEGKQRAGRLEDVAKRAEREERWKEFERAEDGELEYFAKHSDEEVSADLDQWQREAIEEIGRRNDARTAREIEESVKSEVETKNPDLGRLEKDEGFTEFAKDWDERDFLDEKALAEVEAWRTGKEESPEVVKSAERLKSLSQKVRAQTPGMLKESDKVNDVMLGTLVKYATENPAKALKHAEEATVPKAKLIEGLKNKGLKAMGKAKTKEERAEIKKNLEETLRGIEESKPKAAPKKVKPENVTAEMIRAELPEASKKLPVGQLAATDIRYISKALNIGFGKIHEILEAEEVLKKEPVIKEPEAKPDTIILYRATSPSVKFEDVFDVKKLKKFKPPKGIKGEFYTSNREYADYFRETYGKDATIENIEIPAEEAKKYETNPGEFFVPKNRQKIEKEPVLKEPETKYAIAESQPFMYSALTRAAESPKFPANLSAKSVINKLKKAPGVKQTEIDTVGLSEWLEGKEKVSRAELVEFLKMNEVRVEETEKGKPNKWIAFAKGGGFFHEVHNFESKKEADVFIKKRTEESPDIGWDLEFKSSEKTNFAEYVLPGGEPGSYRELVLRVPGTTLPEGWRIEKTEDGRFAVYNPLGSHLGNWPTRESAEKSQLSQPGSKGYRSAHWDEPNVIAHIRGDTRIDADGKRRFHVAEFQSDIYSRIAELEATNENSKELAKLKKIFPWGENWHELVAKKALEYAIANDFDGISWDTAKTQVDRWESALRKSVDKIEWDKSKEELRYSIAKTYDYKNQRPGWEIRDADGFPIKLPAFETRGEAQKELDKIKKESRETNQSKVKINARKKGALIFAKTISLHGEKGQRVTLNNLIGKELANKIRESSENTGSFEGDNLTLGGEFYKIIYDQKIPGFLKKYGKKWGAKVGNGKIDTTPVHTMTITPRMRHAIQIQGQAIMEPTGKYKQSELNLAFGGKKKADEAIESVAKEIEAVSVSHRGMPDRVSGSAETKVAEELRKKKRVDLTGAKLTKGNESQEIAELFQVYRSPKMEILHAIYTTEDGIILGHTAMTSGQLGYVQPKENTTRYFTKMQSTFNRLGAAKVHFLHNHPGGNPDMSDEDVDFAVIADNHLKNHLGEFIVIDHGKYRSIRKSLLHEDWREWSDADSMTDLGVFEVTPGTGEWMLKKGPQMTGPKAVAAFGRNLAYDKSKACFVYVDGDSNIQGWSTHDNKILKKRIPDLEKILRQQAKGHNAGKVIILADDMALLEPIAKYGKVGDWLLDALDTAGNSLREIDPAAFRVARESAKPAWGLFEPGIEYGEKEDLWAWADDLITKTLGGKSIPTEKERLFVHNTSSEPITEDDYILNRKESKSIKLTARTGAKRVASEIVEGIDKFLGSISTRLGQVSLKLKAKIRRLDFDINTKHAADVKKIYPLLLKAKKMTSSDYADWDYARKNSDVGKIQELVEKYNMQKEYAAYRQTLDSLRSEGIDVGLAIGKIDEYAPRYLKDSKGFLTAIGKADEWPVYSRRLQERANELGISVAEMTPDMKADTISNMILGGWSGLGGIPATKKRKLKKIPAYLNKYYMDSDAALMQHLYSMRKGIEARKFFGKIPKKVTEIRKRLHAVQAKYREISKRMKESLPEKELEKLRKQRNKYIGLERQYSAYIAKYALQRDYTENIGSYVMELITNKEISPQHERIVNDILNARFHEAGTRGLIQAYKNLSYIDTMGSPISATTQIGDLAWALYEGGFIGTTKHAFRALVNKSRITKEDVGITRIAQEFADSGTLGKAVTKVFKIIGLEKIDSIGKEALLNVAFEKYQKQAKDDPATLKKKISPIFENETDSVIEDLLNDEISENVKLLVHSRLLDFQPVALSETPQKYLDAGNGRLFYMLKTFTIKVFDVYRNEVYYKIKNGLRLGDNAEVREGLKNLARLSIFFVLCNAGADELKDWMLGRKTDFSDRMIDNALRLFGVSKFVTWKARTEGVGSALARQILPPFKFIDSAGKDIITAGDEKGLEIVGSIPVIGKFAYWHMGRGVSKREDLWNRRLRKHKSKLNKVKEGFEKAKDKDAFRRKHWKELSELQTTKILQAKLNKRRKKINELKSKKELPSRKKLIQNLEKERTELIRKFLQKKDKYSGYTDSVWAGVLGTTKKTDIIQSEIKRLVDTGLLTSSMKPARKDIIGRMKKKIELTDEQYSQLVADTEKEERRRLERFVGKEGWKDMSDERKVSIIKKSIAKARAKARKNLRRDIMRRMKL